MGLSGQHVAADGDQFDRKSRGFKNPTPPLAAADLMLSEKGILNCFLVDILYCTVHSSHIISPCNRCLHQNREHFCVFISPAFKILK